MRRNVIKEKSFKFAVRIVELYKFLSERNEYVLSKQLLRSGTSVGANVRESINAQSSADFIHKLSIAQKECDESIYWLELLYKTNFISENEFNSFFNEASELLRILRSIILTTKQRYNPNS
ncbi:four helix bundle protein [Parabacteroides sp. OttesenSCG-928-G21]|nr:four helix bundle protein [Parabacteroides sp. OttesenSCG-928-G21]